MDRWRTCIAGRAIRRRLQVASLVVVIWAVAALPSRAVANDCLSSSGEAAVSACRQALLHNPEDLTVRTALGNALMGLRRYAEAAAVLREGLERFPGDENVKKQLTLAESYLEEQQWIEKRQQKRAAASAARKTDANLRLSLIRCTGRQGDAAIAACNEGLRIDPGNAELLMARGEAWLKQNQPAKAVADFKAVQAGDPDHREAAINVRLAETKRSAQRSACLSLEGAAGLTACDAALLPGADDAFSIQKRRAQLLHGMGRDAEALTAYREAAHLNQGDIQVQRALALLSPQAETTAPEPRKAPVAPVTAEKPAPTAKPVPAPEKEKPPVLAAVKPRPVAPAVEQDTARKTAVSEKRTAQPAPTIPPAKVEEIGETPSTADDAPAATIAAAAPPRYSNLPRIPGVTH